MVWKPDTCRECAGNRQEYASTMTDREWAKIFHIFLQTSAQDECQTLPSPYHKRDFYLLQSGCQWDMIPKGFPPWQTVYRYFRDWRKDGIWARMDDALYAIFAILKGVSKAPVTRLWTASRSKQAQMRAKGWGLMQENV